jgi:hypothetical protein
MPTIRACSSQDDNKPSPLEAFEACAEARALLFARGVFDLHEAVDELQDHAVRRGLVDEIGQDAVQHIMSEAFRPVREATQATLVDEAMLEATLELEAVLNPELAEAAAEPKPPPPPSPPPKPHVPQSVLDAADYVRRQGDPERLRRWLGDHQQYLAGIFKHWKRHGQTADG